MLHTVHDGRLGATKCQLCIHDSVYWPGINADIQCIVEACQIMSALQISVAEPVSESIPDTRAPLAAARC